MSIKSKLQALRSGVSFFGLVVAFSSPYYPAHAGSSTITVKDSAGATQTFDVVTDGSGNFVQKSVACDQSAAANCASVDASHNLGVVVGEALPGGTATLGVVNVLTITNPLPGGTNTLGTVNATITSLPAGSATIGAVLPALIATWGLAAVGAGTAPTNALVGGVIYNSTEPTLTTGQSVAMQSDIHGNVIVANNGAFTVASIANALPSGTNTLGAVSAIVGSLPGGTATLGTVNAAITGSLPGGTNTIGAVSAIVASLPGGTATLGAVSAIVNALPAGANKIGTFDPATISTWGLSAVSPGTAPTNAMVGGVVYNSTQPTLTTGQAMALQSDNRGNLFVNIASGNFTLAGSTTNVTQWAGTTLGAISNYGTSPGAVSVPAFNAFVTNALPGGTNTIGAVSAIVGSLPGGTNTIGAVAPSTISTWGLAPVGAGTAPTNMAVGGVVYTSTQPTLTTGQSLALQSDNRGNLNVNIAAGSFTLAGSTTNVTQWAGTTLGAISNYGTSPGAVEVPAFNAYVTNTNSNGQTSMAASSPVVIASNQTAVPGTLAAGTMADLLTMRGTVSPGTAPADALVGGVVYNSTQPTLTTGQSMAIQSDNHGNVIVANNGNFTIAGIVAALPGGTNTLGSVNAILAGGTATIGAISSIVNALPGGTATLGAVSAIVGALPAGANKIGTVDPATIATWGLAPVGAGTAPTNMAVGGAVYTSTQPTLTTGQSLALQSDNRGNLNVNVAAGNFTLAGGTTNITQWGGSTLGATSAFGTTPGAVQVPGVNAYVINNNPNGQTSMAASSPVVIASNQSAVPGTLAAGTMADLLTMQGPVAHNTAAANSLLTGAVYTSTPGTLTTTQQVALQVSARGGLLLGSQYPAGAIPIAATALGTTGVVTGTLAGLTLATTFLCTLSVRSNANAAATGTVIVAGPSTTLSYAHWTGVNSLGIGVTEMIYSPCLPASAAGAVITIASPAPGTGGVVSVDATGYQL